MNKIMTEQKLERVVDDKFDNINYYLRLGYVIKQISACYIDSTINHSVCYVVLEKENKDE